MLSPTVSWRHHSARRSPGRGSHALDELGTLPPVLEALLSATDRAGKEVSWGVFVQRYTPLLLRTAHRFAHSYDEAMDRYTYLLEQLCRDDFRRLRAFGAQGRARFTTWLVVVVRRSLLDYHRHRYGRARGLTPADREEARAASALRRRLVEMVGEKLDAADIEDSSHDLERGTYATECGEALQAALCDLEPRDQLLVKLRYDSELAAREIADLLGFPTQFHVYRRLNAVVALLRQTVPAAYREYVG